MAVTIQFNCILCTHPCTETFKEKTTSVCTRCSFPMDVWEHGRVEISPLADCEPDSVHYERISVCHLGRHGYIRTMKEIEDWWRK